MVYSTYLMMIKDQIRNVIRQGKPARFFEQTCIKNRKLAPRKIAKSISKLRMERRKGCGSQGQ